MWLIESLTKILAMNLVLYFCLKKYFGFVRVWLYWLIVAVGIFVGYLLDMQALVEQTYSTYIAMGIVFALLTAICIYEYLFESDK